MRWIIEDINTPLSHALIAMLCLSASCISPTLKLQLTGTILSSYTARSATLLMERSGLTDNKMKGVSRGLCMRSYCQIVDIQLFNFLEDLPLMRRHGSSLMRP